MTPLEPGELFDVRLTRVAGGDSFDAEHEVSDDVYRERRFKIHGIIAKSGSDAARAAFVELVAELGAKTIECEFVRVDKDGRWVVRAAIAGQDLAAALHKRGKVYKL